MNIKDEKTVLRETDDDARTLARHLLREARHASLATLDHRDGTPIASRATMANLMDGTPVILVSELSDHTPNLQANSKCSLLIGRLGSGDPLAHPRMTVVCDAIQLDKSTEDHQRARSRFLNRHPKAALYVDFGDFHFFRLDVKTISLNGGFGKAYRLGSEDLLTQSIDSFYEMEPGVVEHMNDDHAHNITDYARHFGFKEEGRWLMSGIDPAGIDLACGDVVRRIDFHRTLESADEIRPMLVKMAKEAKG